MGCGLVIDAFAFSHIPFGMTMNDLSPDALDQLEAKLLADLEIVRRVRALIAEHRTGLAVPASVAPVAAPLWVPSDKPQKRREQIIQDALAGLPTSTFRKADFLKVLSKEGWNPTVAMMRTLLQSLTQKGVIEIAAAGKGSPGHLYRRLSSGVASE